MPQKQPNSYYRYANLAIQMGLIIGGFSWLGSWLDGRFGTHQPWFTIMLSLSGIGGSLYLVIKDVMKEK
jgi:F0F1-type ATP synthase assembly protein I